MVNNPIATGSEWNFDWLKTYDKKIAEIARGYHLETYPNQIEVINAEQMMDAYAAIGMPLTYPHWSYGKRFVQIEQQYRRGHMGLAYEIVINSNPCIAYLMEENSMAMQILVLAHAAYGHNSFFKSNYLFKTWTNADAIIDYLLFAKNYIAECEERYGHDKVEAMLDACHALMNYGVDRYKHPPKLSASEEKKRQQERERYLQSQVNDLWRTIPQQKKENHKNHTRFVEEPQENILYFIEKNAPLLESWQREIVRIVRKIAQYFYPQRQTKVMNEGWATFWHYQIINDLYDQNLINESYMIELIKSHTDVLMQPAFNTPHYSGINPYTLGFNLYRDIRRICENPTDEDREWFPDIAKSDWLSTLDFAMRNYKDESIIRQYLSPHLIRQLRLFALLDDEEQRELEISDIHNEAGYRHIRTTLAEQYHLNNHEPNIQVYDVDVRGDRTLTLRHIQHQKRPLNKNTMEVLKHIYQLWQFPVRLQSFTTQGEKICDLLCPQAKTTTNEGEKHHEK